MLKTIRLTNFRSHYDTTIEFTNGLNVIIGENGAGKSSIFQAIGIGLFNSIHNMKELVRYDQLSAMVDIEFDYHGTSYRSVREFGKVSSWRLFRQGVVEAEGQDAMVKKLSEIFGLTEILDLPSFFNEMIGVGQFMMVAPFVETPSMRRIFFNRLLRTDEYTNTASDLHQGERHGEELLKKDELKLVELRTQLDFFQKGQAELEETLVSLTHLNDSLAGLHIMREQTQAFLGQLELQRKSFLKAVELQMALKLEETDLKGKVALHENLLAIAAQQLEESKTALMILPQVEKEWELYQLQLARYEKGLEETSRVVMLEQQLKERYEKLSQNDTCPICDQDISSSKDRLLEETALQLGKLHVPSVGARPQPPRRYEQVKELVSQMDGLSSRHDERKQELEMVQQEFHTLIFKITNLYMPPFDEREFEQAKQDLARFEQEIAIVETKIEATRRIIDKIAAMTDPSPQIEIVQKAVEGKRKSLDTLKNMREVYRKLGPIMAQRLLAEINTEAKIFFNNILGDHYQVDVFIGVGYEIMATIDGNLVSFTNLSGGQQVCLALAIRLALLKVLSGMEFMLIDEPFDSLDELAQEAVVKSLSELSKGQMIVITHNDAFDAENVIKFELENGVSHAIA